MMNNKNALKFLQILLNVNQKTNKQKKTFEIKS